jgi:uncharacterized repeat protein (TIGR04042 family)
MPVVTFRVRWPDGRVEDCFSPSRVVEEYLVPGRSYPVDDFVHRSRRALEAADRKVEEKYGFSCSGTMQQLRIIERRAAALGPEGRAGAVEVLALEGPPGFVPRSTG